MTAALEGGEWSAARPGRTLPPGKTRYPFYRRLGGVSIGGNVSSKGNDGGGGCVSSGSNGDAVSSGGNVISNGNDGGGGDGGVSGDGASSDGIDNGGEVYDN